MKSKIDLKATGLYAGLVACILSPGAIALWGTGALSERIAESLMVITGLLAAGLVVDLGFKNRDKPKDKNQQPTDQRAE